MNGNIFKIGSHSDRLIFLYQYIFRFSSYIDLFQDLYSKNFNSVVLIWYAYHQKLNFQHVVNKLHKHIHRRIHSAKKKRKKLTFILLIMK